MKKYLFIIITLFCGYPSFSQTYTLEQIDFSPLGNAINFNTYPMGINNNGFVCGYYQNTVTNDTTGFVITPEGKIILITSAITGAGSYGIKAIGINDSNMVLVNYLEAGGISRLHKCFVNNNIIVNDWPITNNIGQNNIKAFHYNNKGDITGWYQGVGNRWMFTLHDGTPPAGFNAWQAWRYEIPIPYTFYNTMAGAMDTNRIVTGFYIDGSQNIPFLYEEIYAMFYVLNGSTWCHPWGKNNNGKIVGEYKNAGGYLNAFVAAPTFTPGQPNSGQLNLTSLANIFHSNTIQSVARAINDKDEVVGSFIDPTNGNSVGFIYRPNSGEYKIQNYSFTKHVWNLFNSKVATGNPGTTKVWTTNFYDNYKYDNVDPFANNGYPLWESFITGDPEINNLANYSIHDSSSCPDWNSFMKEIVGSSNYYTASQSPIFNSVYRYIYKRNLFKKYVANYATPFGGICYGFAATSAMHFVDDTHLNSTYNIGANTNLISYTNQSSDAITAITRCYLKQNDPKMAQYFPQTRAKVPNWNGLYRFKHSLMKGDSLKYRQIYLGWITGYNGAVPIYGYHSVFPYKCRTPQKLPFLYNNVMQYDTLYIYDSNYAISQNEYFLIKSEKLANPIDSTSGPQYQNPGFFVTFNETTVEELLGYSNTQLKKSRAIDSLVRMSISPKCSYLITDAATLNTAFENNMGYNSTISSIIPIELKNNAPVRISQFYRDTIAELQVTTTQYEDSVMSFNFDNQQIQMGLSRKALPGENDNATFKNRYISYGNPDNITKDLYAEFVQLDPGLPTACQISVSGLALPQNDSIITLNPANYQYQIIHPGNTNLTYNLTVVAIYNDTVKQFNSNSINVSGLTSHIIDPYFNGAQGLQTAVIIDNGLNATNDDTLFVPEVPLSVDTKYDNVHYISLFPNPTHNKFFVSLSKASKENYYLLLTDIYGKVIKSEAINHQGGTHQYAYDISQASAGIYFVMVFDKNKKALFLQKLLKQ